MRKKRKNYTPEEKVRIIKEHLINGVPISELCDQHQLQPTVFYRWSPRIPISQQQILNWIGMSTSKFNDWEQRYGQRNQHNARLPKGQWIKQWEKEAILDYYDQHPQEGYRRLSYMMLDADVVAVSPSSVYRVL